MFKYSNKIGGLPFKIPFISTRFCSQPNILSMLTFTYHKINYAAQHPNELGPVNKNIFTLSIMKLQVLNDTNSKGAKEKCMPTTITVTIK